MPHLKVAHRRFLRLVSIALGLYMAAQAWYFTACVTVNWPDDDRSDPETRKLQSRINRHREVSAIFRRHGQSGLVMHRETRRTSPHHEDKTKKAASQSRGQAQAHPLVIPYMPQFTPAELDQITSIVAEESQKMGFSESVEFENVATKQITRRAGAQAVCERN